MTVVRSTLTNKHNQPYDQVIKDKRYLIAPGETISLPRREAVTVRGYYPGKDVVTMLEMQHHGDVIEQHVCNKCSMIFDNAEDFAAHIKSHAEKKEKIFACPYCDAEMKTKAALLAHIRAKHEEKEVTNDTSRNTGNGKGAGV